MTPLDLVSSVHKGSVHGGYLLLSMVGAPIDVKEYPTVVQYYLGPPSAVDLDRVLLEIYLFSWSSANLSGILTCEENIAFDGSPESWPVFRIELTGIIIQLRLLQLFPPASSGGVGNIPLTSISGQFGWGWSLRWRLITRSLGGRWMKVTWTESACGPS